MHLVPKKKIRIIAEIGSTHCSKWEYCKEAIERAADLNVDAIKFQLFPNRAPFIGTGNVWMPPELYLQCAEHAKEEGIECSASVFGDEEFDFLIKTRPPFIKFAYSQNDQRGWIEETIEEGIEAIVSCDVMSDRKLPENTTRLFCLPHYPVYYQIKFDGLFPRFHGFSDHSMGYEQTLEAIYEGAQTIEKHVTLSKPDIHVPDSYFALPFGDFASMVASIRRIEKEGTL